MNPVSAASPDHGACGHLHDPTHGRSLRLRHRGPRLAVANADCARPHSAKPPAECQRGPCGKPKTRAPLIQEKTPPGIRLHDRPPPNAHSPDTRPHAKLPTPTANN
eukprot:4886852-Alexandrium_andersonii.AAC.1